MPSMFLGHIPKYRGRGSCWSERCESVWRAPMTRSSSGAAVGKPAQEDFNMDTTASSAALQPSSTDEQMPQAEDRSEDSSIWKRQRVLAGILTLHE